MATREEILSAAIGERDRTIADLQDALAKRTYWAQLLDAAVGQRDAVIADLQWRLDEAAAEQAASREARRQAKRGESGHASRR